MFSDPKGLKKLWGLLANIFHPKKRFGNFIIKGWEMSVQVPRYNNPTDSPSVRFYSVQKKSPLRLAKRISL